MAAPQLAEDRPEEPNPPREVGPEEPQEPDERLEEDVEERDDVEPVLRPQPHDEPVERCT
jgi:hypothetical protein